MRSWGDLGEIYSIRKILRVGFLAAEGQNQSNRLAIGKLGHALRNIIGDIHGHADAIKALLRRMGYTQSPDAWRHPER